MCSNDHLVYLTTIVSIGTIWIDVPKDVNATAGTEFRYTISFATTNINPTVVWFKNYLKLPKLQYEDTWRRVGAKYKSDLYFSKLDTSHTGTYRAMVDLKEVSPIEKDGKLTVWCRFFFLILIW